MKVELKEGLTFDIIDEALNDWEVVELLADLEENPLNMVPLARRLLSPGDYEKLKKLNTSKEGRVNAEAVANMLTNILLAGNDTKK